LTAVRLICAASHAEAVAYARGRAWPPTSWLDASALRVIEGCLASEAVVLPGFERNRYRFAIVQAVERTLAKTTAGRVSLPAFRRDVDALVR
jgi:hypothetical protein